MTDILLIHPAATHGIYGALGDKLTAVEQPLWCRLIAGYLLDRGWDVAIHDMEIEDKAQLTLKLASCPKIIAICVYGHQPSASTQQMVGARKVAQWLRSLPGDRRIVMLGNHPSALPERTLREEPVDYVIDGEGPVALDGLLRGDMLNNIPGLVYRVSRCAERPNEELIMRNVQAPLIPIKELHGNAWHLLPPPRRYRSHAWQCLDNQKKRTPYAAIYTSLGCPYKCHFCMINAFQHTNKYRMRDPESVVSEVFSLYCAGVNTFKIIDELFVLNRQHYKAICKGLVDSGLGKEINIWAYARTDTIDPEDLPLMRKAGIKWLALGIESGDLGVRAGVNKALKTDKKVRDPDLIMSDNPTLDIYHMVKAIQTADINVIGNYIFGLPDDTNDTMEETLELALWLRTEWANFYCAMPYPGSALYDDVSKERPDDLPPSWAAYSQHNRYTKPLRNNHLSAAEILKFRDSAFIQYFMETKYREFISGKFGPQAIEHIDQMLSYKLERDLLK